MDVNLGVPSARISWWTLRILRCRSRGVSTLCACRKCRKFFVLCTSVELRRYRVDGLLDGYKARGVVTHHHPVHEGMATDIASCLAMLDELRGCLEDGKCMVIHCFEGLGRSCLDTLTADQAIEALCSVRGSRAIQTIKQYNFVHEFRTLSEAHREAKFLATTARSVSR